MQNRLRTKKNPNGYESKVCKHNVNKSAHYENMTIEMKIPSKCYRKIGPMPYTLMIYDLVADHNYQTRGGFSEVL